MSVGNEVGVSSERPGQKAGKLRHILTILPGTEPFPLQSYTLSHNASLRSRSILIVTSEILRTPCSFLTCTASISSMHRKAECSVGKGLKHQERWLGLCAPCLPVPPDNFPCYLWEPGDCSIPSGHLCNIWRSLRQTGPLMEL